MASTNGSSNSGIWDDTALVDAWDEALEEYKKYHSIKARGDGPDKTVMRAGDRSYGQEGDMDYEDGQANEGLVHDPHAKKELAEETTVLDTTPNERLPLDKSTSPEKPSNGVPTLPQHLIGQVHDEGLKNLLMSWYYAGYYTGLWEGQQQGRAGMNAKPEA